MSFTRQRSNSWQERSFIGLVSQLLSFLPSYFTLQFCKSYSLCIGGLWRGSAEHSAAWQRSLIFQSTAPILFSTAGILCPWISGQRLTEFSILCLNFSYSTHLTTWQSVISMSVTFCAFGGRDSPSSLWAPHTHHGVENPADDKYSSVNERRQHKWTGKLTATQKWHAFPFSSAAVTSFATLEGRRETGSGRLALVLSGLRICFSGMGASLPGGPNGGQPLLLPVG